MENNKTNYKTSINSLRILISQIQDPYLRREFDNWIHNNLSVVNVTHTIDSKSIKQVSSFDQFNYYNKQKMIEVLANEIATKSQKDTTKYGGFPGTIFENLSVMIVGKKI